MPATLRLAWRYVCYHRVKSAILVAAITLAAVLPLVVGALVSHFERQLMARARSTPLVVGARGSRFDLVLHALYFRAKTPQPLATGDLAALRAERLARAVPLYARFRARGRPIVGTTLEYFPFRGLRVERGAMLQRLGDCLLGADVAAELDLAPGGRLMSDPENVFDIAGVYPVNLRVQGVLARSGSPDDGAVFVDLKTAWLIEGIGHGHQDVTRAAPDDVLLSRTDREVRANAALPQYTEVTDENLDSFHFHGDPQKFPITAVLVQPRDAKSQAILLGRYQSDPRLQALEPEAVVEELLAVVFRVKRLFDANLALVALSTALFLLLVVLLSLRLRRREMETMFKLGCSRGTMAALQAAELGIILAMSLALSAGVAGLALWAAPHLAAAWLAG